MLIDHDLENSPFFIKTDSVLGRDDLFLLKFYDAQGRGAGGIVFLFSTTPKYHVRECDPEGRTDFPIPLPSETVKVWKVTLTRKSVVGLVIHCNGQEVLNLKISGSTCDFTFWSTDWGRVVEKVKFLSKDTASDFYSPFLFPYPLGMIWCMYVILDNCR